MDEADKLVRAVHGVRGDADVSGQEILAVGYSARVEEGLPHVALED